MLRRGLFSTSSTPRSLGGTVSRPQWASSRRPFASSSWSTSSSSSRFGGGRGWWLASSRGALPVVLTAVAGGAAAAVGLAYYNLDETSRKVHAAEHKEYYQLPELPWGRSALEPHISKETIDYHYGKHHQGYVNKLNDMIKGTKWAQGSLEKIIKESPAGPLLNNAAQSWNHNFYWHSMSPLGGGLPTGEIRSLILKSWPSFESFKDEFSNAAGGHFGSGWVWLVYDPKDDKLHVHSTHDAGNPLRDGTGIPLLTCDVWEHAFYIDYRNAKAEYVKAWWNVVNWKFANDQLARARGRF
ncbi:Superoxide dismutase [Balamuthia mandrillaris]